MARKTDGFHILCDLDMVCMNDLPKGVANLIESNVPICYDITEQTLISEEALTLVNDISQVGRIKSEGRWYGGELLGGPGSFFKQLVEQIDEVFDNYVSTLDTLHHVGDETFVTAAIEKLCKKGIYIANIGTLGGVARYWNMNSFPMQRSIESLQKVFLLHLPNDKHYLARLADKPESYFDKAMLDYTSRVKVRRLEASITKPFRIIRKLIKG